MKDDDLHNRDDAAVDNAAADAEMTDEQLWAELDKDDPTFADADPDDDDDQTNDPHGDGGDTAEGWDGDAEDSAKGASEDDEQGEGPKSDDAKDDPDHLRKQIERLEHALKSEKGRTAASRREIDRLTQRISEARESAPGDGKGNDSSKREETEQQLEQMREEFGDTLGPLIDKVKEFEEREDRLSAWEERERQTIQARIDDLVEGEIAKFEEEHPDGWDVLRDNAGVFRDWIEDQPKRVRDLWDANREQVVDGIGAAYLVSQFKQSLQNAQGQPPDTEPNTDNRLQHRRQRQLDGARSARPQTRHSTAMQSGPPDTDDPEKLWEFFEKKDRAKA